MFTTKELIDKLGMPQDTTRGLARLHLPFKMKLAWDTKVEIGSFLCHPIVYDQLEDIFNDIIYCYGLELIEHLSINHYGGCYNYRRMRSGSAWSKHAWAIAIDLFPQQNRLRWNHEKAAFARPEYNDLIEIFYQHGYCNLGVERDYDWMHFEPLIFNSDV